MKCELTANTHNRAIALFGLCEQCGSNVARDETPSPVQQDEDEMWDSVIGIVTINRYKEAMAELKSKFSIQRKQQ